MARLGLLEGDFLKAVLPNVVLVKVLTILAVFVRLFHIGTPPLGFMITLCLYKVNLFSSKMLS